MAMFDCKTCASGLLVRPTSRPVYAPLLVGLVDEVLEHTLRIRERQQAAVATLGQRALGMRDLGALLQHAAALVVDTLEVEYAEVTQVQPGDDGATLRAAAGQRGDASAAPGLRATIRAAGRAWGVIDAHTDRRRVFTGDDQHFLTAVANVLAAAVEMDTAHRRQALVTEITTVLSASLDYEATLRTLARLAVPELADWCFVDVGDARGVARRVAVAHLDPTQETLAWEIGRRGALDPYALDGVSAVLRSGRSDLRPMYRDEGLGLRSLMLVPLTARDRTFGVLALAAGPERRRFTSEDLALAEELASRAALAADNARLFEEAATSSRLKDDFLSVVSHELRTPLTAILGWARLLRVSALPPGAVARGLAAIERNAVSQAALVDDLLDMSRLAAGRFALDVRAVDLADVVEASMEAAHADASAGHVALELSRPGTPVVVSADHGRLQQIVGHLLSNAIKFTPAGGRVTVNVERQGERARMTVRDTGVGVAPEFLPFVFDAFRQADSSLTRVHGGLGIGLTIVRHLVELHGGHVTASSPGPDTGATFVVELPIRDASATAADATQRPAPKLEGVRVLVVEDEPDTRDLLVAVLGAYGAATRAVASVADAVQSVSTSPPDVVVADIGLPGEDGYALIDRLHDGWPGVPAVALTGYARSEDRERALAAGYRVHLSKPVDPTELVRVVTWLATT